MAEQMKKNKSADYTEKEKEQETPSNPLTPTVRAGARNLRMNPMQKRKAPPIRRKYQTVTMGLPPLKMVLVHAANDRANAASKTISKSQTKGIRSKEEAVIKIIEHLIKSQ